MDSSALVLLLALILVTHVQASRTTFQLPYVSMRIELEELNDWDDADFSRAFEERLLKVTRNHLRRSLGYAGFLPKNDFLEDITLLLDLDQARDFSQEEEEQKSSSLNTVVLQADFTGMAAFVSDKRSVQVERSRLYEIVRSALSSDGYWLLRHEFWNDDILTTIANVDIFVHSFRGYDGQGGNNGSDRKTNLSVVVPVVVVSTALIFFAISLFAYTYRRGPLSSIILYRKKGADETASDDSSETAPNDEERAMETTQEEEQEDILMLHLPPRNRPLSKRALSRTRQRCNVPPNLKCIPEEEEEEEHQEARSEISIHSEFDDMKSVSSSAQGSVVTILSGGKDDDMFSIFEDEEASYY